MPKRSCALIGPGVGPKVQVGSVARISLRGMQKAEIAVLDLFKDSEPFVTLFFENGTHELPFCNFARVKYEGKSREFIACVLTGGQEDALHSS